MLPINARDRRGTSHARRRAVIAMLLAAGGLAGLNPSVAMATQLFVDDDAVAGGDGLSWATAHASLQDALLAAAAADGGVTELRIAQGTYRPDDGSAITPGDRDASFSLPNGLTLRGGFAGPGEVDPDARNPNFETILSGDLSGDDGPDFANTEDNSFHVVVAIAVEATLDGITIAGARADGPDYGPIPESRDRGGALDVHGAQLTVMNCTFRDNWVANRGAVSNHGGVVLTDCTFRNNFAGDRGGGLYLHQHSETEAIGCAFIDNDAEKGGGLYMAALSATLTNCTFTGNTAELGGGFYGDVNSGALMAGCVFTENLAPKGGGIFADFSTTRLIKCTFTSNVAINGEGGGGVWFQEGDPAVDACVFTGNIAFAGGGLYNKLAAARVRNCIFIGNAANDGGALWNEGPGIVVTDCEFTDNIGETGGGIYNDASDPLIVNCTFTGNEVTNGDGGGGIANAFESAPLIVGCTFTENAAESGLFGGGGAMANYISTPVIRECTFIRNTAVLGGGALYNELFDSDAPSIIDCVFFGNAAGDGGAVQNFRSGPYFMNCAFVGNTTMSSNGYGGALYNQFLSAPTLLNCTVTGNAANDGGGMSSRDSAAPLMINSIVWDNAGGALTVGPFGSSVDVRYSCVEGGFEGPGIIDAQPSFMAAPFAGDDGVWGTDDDFYGDLRLAPDSAAIDAGHNASIPLDLDDVDEDLDVLERIPFDLGGMPRFADHTQQDDVGCGSGAVVDQGAYEFQGIAGTVRFGDLDGDGVVGVPDIMMLVAAWGPCPGPCCEADVNGSGAVNFDDLLEQIAAWGM